MYPFVKRIMDVLGAILALAILSPFLLLIAILIKLDSPGPVLYRQERLGKGGLPFLIYKFRTMRQDASVVPNPDGSSYVSSKDPRLTRVGRFLREFTIDEVPQLINVLRGEMSLVGPRPDEVGHLVYYDDLLKRKLDVLPGMANLALVHGRNAIPWRERARWDAYYVDHRSLGLDLEILFKTAILVVLRRGVYYPEDDQGQFHLGPGSQKGPVS